MSAAMRAQSGLSNPENVHCKLAARSFESGSAGAALIDQSERSNGDRTSGRIRAALRPFLESDFKKSVSRIQNPGILEISVLEVGAEVRLLGSKGKNQECGFGRLIENQKMVGRTICKQNARARSDLLQAREPKTVVQIS